jgi:hypothetical protein
MSMFGTHLSPSTLIAKQWIANEYVASDLIFIGRRDDDWVEGYKPHVMEMHTLKDIIASSLTFIELLDTPSNYIGSAGYFVLVNPTEDGLIFQAPVIEETRYEARINFNGAIDPIVSSLLINNLPVTVTLDRTALGTYRANFSGAVTSNKLVMYIGNTDLGAFHVNTYSSNYIEFIHTEYTGNVNDADFIVAIEIKLYP